MVEGFRYKRAKFKTARILRTEECGVESLVIISLSGTSNQLELRILTGYLLYQVPGVRTESRRGTLRLMARGTTWRAENIKFRLELKVNI